MIMISKFLFNLTNSCVMVCIFFTELLTLSILFSTAVNAVFVAKLLKSGTLFSNSASQSYQEFSSLILFFLFDI